MKDSEIFEEGAVGIAFIKEDKVIQGLMGEPVGGIEMGRVWEGMERMSQVFTIAE